MKCKYNSRTRRKGYILCKRDMSYRRSQTGYCHCPNYTRTLREKIADWLDALIFRI